jgi:hypothetical protein
VSVANRSFVIPLGVALAAVTIQIVATLVGQRFGYGYFIDSLYYSCARRLDFAMSIIRHSRQRS